MKVGQDEDGFTLVELLVAIVITALITSAIVASLIVGLKTTDATATRLAESHDAQLVSTYLVADVQSAGEAGVDTTPGASSGCGAAGDEGGYASVRNVLRLTWTESAPSSVTYTAAYRMGRNTSTGEWQLLRYACQGGGTATSIVVGRQLADPAATPPVVDLSRPPAVSLKLTEPSGYVYYVAAVRRTPATTALPLVPWDCTIQSALASPDPALRTTAAPGPLATDLSVDIQSGGACSALKLVVDPGGSAGDVYTKALTESPVNSGHWVTTINRSTGTWTDGDKSFPILQAGTTLGTLRMVVKQPCLVTTLLADPSPARRAPGPSPGRLATDETITVTTTGPCLPVEVDVRPNPAAPRSTLLLTESSPGTWTVTVAPNTMQWSDGDHLLTAHEMGGATLATTTLTVTPNCVITTSSVTPSPVGLDNGTRRDFLLSDVTLSLTTSGTCTGLQAEFTPGATPAAPVPFTATAPGWTATLSKDGYTWTSGTKTIKVRNDDGDVVATLTLVVS